MPFLPSFLVSSLVVEVDEFDPDGEPLAIGCELTTETNINKQTKIKSLFMIKPGRIIEICIKNRNLAND